MAGYDMYLAASKKRVITHNIVWSISDALAFSALSL